MKKKSLFLSWMPRQKALFTDLWNEPLAMNWRVWLPFRGALIVWRNGLIEILGVWAKVNAKSYSWAGVIPGIGEPSLRADVQKSFWILQVEHESGMCPCDDESWLCTRLYQLVCSEAWWIMRCSQDVLSQFWFSSTEEDIDNKVTQVGGHWDALWMDANVMPGEPLRSGWIFHFF